jgi:hypothetical protein
MIPRAAAAAAAALAICLAACRGEPPVQSQPDTSRTAAMPTPAPPAADDHRLSENQPGSLSDRKVVAFNIWERSYERADGSQATGPAAVLSVSDGKTPVEHVVGVGSRVTIGNDLYEVVSVDDGKASADQIGHVVLRAVKR